ncbi:MAG: 3'-5' exonuclease [Candidatus Heimdallarchaeota archaeon]
MASASRDSSSFQGYRSWFKPFRYRQRTRTPIFVLDFESDSKWEESHIAEFYDSDSPETGGRGNRINGIQIYFLDQDHVKRKAFLRHSPYFYLLVEDGILSSDLIRIQNEIWHQGGNKIVNVEITESYDAEELTFLKQKPFIRVTVDHPGSVPSLREQLERIEGIIEWREADVLFHHRVAIDHNIRVGYWYEAEIDGGEITKLSPIPNKAPPELRVIAFDIETTFEQNREPNPYLDVITMISLFTGDTERTGNLLLINSQVVDSSNIRNFNIILRQKDHEHLKPWVDWIPLDEIQSSSNILEGFPVQVLSINGEAELLRVFFQFIRDYQPDVLADFFGGRFDIPFLTVRAEKHRLSLQKETGFRIVLKNQFEDRKSVGKGSKNLRGYSASQIDHVAGAGIIHLDTFDFNEKYSYLPKKDLGLKQSVEKKLKILPIGREALFGDDPVLAAAYAASDGYITWKYAREIVLGFFISLGQMFPVSAAELLSRRSGSLDDLLIDAEDYKHNIIGRRRISQKNRGSFSPNITIESLAFTGGLVEARRPGIFRSDIYYDFTPNKTSLKTLKPVIAKIIEDESESSLQKTAAERFEAFVSSELDNLNLPYSDDHKDCIRKIRRGLSKNGLGEKEVSEKIEETKRILDEIKSLHIVDSEKVKMEILENIDNIAENQGRTQLRGLHVDVTSMYPSQIRQYKLQPSGIVSKKQCTTCEFYEPDQSCYFEGDWIVKLSGRRPCRYLVQDTNKCDPSICTSEKAQNCKNYEPFQTSRSRYQEVYTFNGEKTRVYRLRNKSELKSVPIRKSYLGSVMDDDPFHTIQKWLEKSVDATELTRSLGFSQIDLFEDQSSDLELPEETYLSLDVRTKNLVVFLSVRSRVCQKAYNFLARIMDDFFNTRVSHKKQAQQLEQRIKQKTKRNEPVSAELLSQQKFHDSTQLGMKVPLNSIYGLLGMKGGVRNASTPSAGITTKLSADLIQWAADQLEQIGWVTELDTDGIWLWLPKTFPIDFPVFIGSKNGNDLETHQVTLIDKILNSQVRESGFINENYWINDGNTIQRMTKSLIRFEQDGGYDFQFVMGKKKYIVYNYLENNPNTKWIEEELTGLESKRADFSKLQKYYQERIINAYLDKYDSVNPITLKELYKHAIETSESIREEIISGSMDISYFVKPKAINKQLDSYKSELPQVTCARILEDLNYRVAPGTRVEMLNVKGKGNHVLPKQIFDLEFEVVKPVLIKHGIGTLSFMLGELKSKEDLRKLIDIQQYIDDIFGPGRIHDRMVNHPMITQNISLVQKIDLETEYETQLKPLKKTEIEGIARKEFDLDKEQKLNQKIRKKKYPGDSITKKTKGRTPFKKQKVRSLEAIFDIAPKREITAKLKKTLKKDEFPDSNLGLEPDLERKDHPTSVRETVLFSEQVLAKNLSPKEEDKGGLSDRSGEPNEEGPIIGADVFINGNLENKKTIQAELELFDDENVFCSECGSIVSLQELSDEGCRICGGQKLFFDE